MGKRKKLLVIVGAIILAVAAAVWISMPSVQEEPEHNARTLSKWLEIWHDTQDDAESARHMEAAKAIRSIGTNGFPFILKWMSYKPSKLREEAARLTRKLPLHITVESGVTEEEEKAYRTIHFFEVMKSNASPLIPNLVPLMNDTNVVERSERAVCALAFIGTNSWPVFNQTLTTTNLAVRQDVILAIALAHKLHFADWSVALPLILRSADDRDANVAFTAVSALGQMGIQPESCIPVLTNKLHSPDTRIRLRAIIALHELGADTESAWAIDAALKDPDPFTRILATNIIEKIREDLSTNSPPK